jgi:peroxiredoxin
MNKCFLKSLKLLACLMCALPCHTAYGSQDQPYLAGSQLSRFTLPAPDSQHTLTYLGLKTMDPCTISQIRAKLVLIEFVNALCPHCHANAPIVNRLYQVIEKDPALAKDVKIIGICVGNDKKQTDAFKKSFKVPFPVFPDEYLAIAQAVELKKTPTMVLVTHSGKVLWSLSGEIRDFDVVLKALRENHKKQ